MVTTPRRLPVYKKGEAMITMVNPGFFTTIQDEGRWGFQSFGMPVAGAMDRFALRTANMLVGNKVDAAVIEMTMLGGIFSFDREQLVAICGAEMQAKVDGKEISNWSAFTVLAGSELKFEYVASGCRAYMAVRGGIDVPPVLGSRSTYTRAKVGGLQGRAIRQDDILSIGQDIEAQAFPRALGKEFIPAYGNEIVLRVLLGPQDDMFTTEGIETLFQGEYKISDEADRMGYRLEGPKINHIGKADIVSDALCHGAIQIPAHGMPIIMMADRQTTGGYPKIGAVIGPDLARLAQAKSGDRVRFARVSEAEAVEALAAERRTYADIAISLQTTTFSSGIKSTFKIVVNGVVYEVELKEVTER